jgi:hypothetical protein
MPYMNCREIQAYFEDNSPEFDKADCAEVTEHVSGCVSCRQIVDTREETSARLRLLRESAPPFPASLDAAVLANYRRRIATRQNSEAASPQGRVRFLGWGLSAAVATMLLIFATVFLVRRPSVTKQVSPPRTNLPEIVRLPPAATPQAFRPEPIRKDTVVAQRLRRGRSEPDAARQTSAADSSVRLADSVPDGFRSLMYCDEISCDGGMEVVRVQLPSPAVGFMPASTAGNHVVTADVLVGADGFARGIRIVH